MAARHTTSTQQGQPHEDQGPGPPRAPPSPAATAACGQHLHAQCCCCLGQAAPHTPQPHHSQHLALEVMAHRLPYLASMERSTAEYSTARHRCTDVVGTRACYAALQYTPSADTHIAWKTVSRPCLRCRSCSLTVMHPKNLTQRSKTQHRKSQHTHAFKHRTAQLSRTGGTSVCMCPLTSSHRASSTRRMSMSINIRATSAVAASLQPERDK
jgi:hypothetical protein